MPQQNKLKFEEQMRFGRYYLLLAVGYSVFWICILLSLEARAIFFSKAAAEGDYLFVLAIDVPVVLLSLYEGANLILNRAPQKWVRYVIAILVLLGTVDTVWVEPFQNVSVLGALLMLLALTLSVALIAGRSETSIVWGPCRFGKSQTRDKRALSIQVVKQVAAMWTVFFAVIPALIYVATTSLRLESQFTFQGQEVLGICIFILFGLIGIPSARAMISDGDGTPLPINGTVKLVISGPYAYTRNPMALAGIVQAIGIGIALGNSAIITYALAGGIIWDVCVRPLEESYLAREFGDSYVRYATAVHCWRIRLSRYTDDGLA